MLPSDRPSRSESPSPTPPALGSDCVARVGHGLAGKAARRDFFALAESVACRGRLARRRANERTSRPSRHPSVSDHLCFCSSPPPTSMRTSAALSTQVMGQLRASEPIPSKPARAVVHAVAVIGHDPQLAGPSAAAAARPRYYPSTATGDRDRIPACGSQQRLEIRIAREASSADRGGSSRPDRLRRRSVVNSGQCLSLSWV